MWKLNQAFITSQVFTDFKKRQGKCGAVFLSIVAVVGAPKLFFFTIRDLCPIYRRLVIFVLAAAIAEWLVLVSFLIWLLCSSCNMVIAYNDALHPPAPAVEAAHELAGVGNVKNRCAAAVCAAVAAVCTAVAAVCTGVGKLLKVIGLTCVFSTYWLGVMVLLMALSGFYCSLLLKYVRSHHC